MSVILTLTNCTRQPEIKYVDRPVEVKIPVKCIVPQAECDFNQPTDTEVIDALVKCLIEKNHNERKCQ